VDRVEFFEHLRPYFFTTDMDFWRRRVQARDPWQSFGRYEAFGGAYIFGILLLALAIFDRKDITTWKMWAKLLLTVLCLSMIASRAHFQCLARTVAARAAAHDVLVCV